MCACVRTHIYPGDVKKSLRASIFYTFLTIAIMNEFFKVNGDSLKLMLISHVHREQNHIKSLDKAREKRCQFNNLS